jgi:hypothetical protein
MGDFLDGTDRWVCQSSFQLTQEAYGKICLLRHGMERHALIPTLLPNSSTQIFHDVLIILSIFLPF